jgi:uncharacterized protein Smg (DUF494 family)
MKRPEYTRDELADRRIFIINEIYELCKKKRYFYYSKLAKDLEYVGITREETYNTIHYLERQGKLLRRKGKM